LKEALEAGKKRIGKVDWESTGNVIPIVGKSPRMIEVYKAMVRVSKTDSTVMITGESGTGKELAARAIHQFSGRREQSFVAVNCGALTETLLESELFGHTKGSFSGALRDHQGIFETASGGTVFLDEITETSPAFQVKLLRILQERAIKPVGASREKAVDVRVISATNKSLESLVNSSFRKDLLYRLSVIHIPLPSLRERVEDIPLLARRFLRTFSRKQNKQVTIPAATLEWMKSQPWPGNVRELENAIERAVTMNITGEIHPEDLTNLGISVAAYETVPNSLSTHVDAPTPVQHSDVEDDPLSLGSLDDVARKHILRVLSRTRGSRVRTAKILGIARPSLYRMAKRLGIDLDQESFEAKRKTKEKS
jgi:transcriptional regulator with GAF, ATPase, and Fis domain